ncbi:hypothetical protein BGZ97_006699 [Linnemannia gamsii]|uniref:Uncharacterized protein n=1 Tax=Linnemannia gamsii TaxID=64522 RepID=A0A9P6RDV5_9FUNG|nr:hypothetical protein BGZ97_006699 [Linnemannia gamsii]
MALCVFFIFRQRRQRRTANKERLLDTEGHLEEAPDPFKSQTKRMQASGSGRSWCESTADASSQKDVIRIAYIPSIASDESIQLPELAALGGGPQASFMASFDDVHNKHSSIASSMSTGTLDEAIVMAVSKKATPQLLRLHTIKSSNSDMIKRSNSLHSSNSIKRTKSQRRVAEANKSTGLQGSQGCEGNQLYDALEQLQSQPEPEQQYTPAVMITGPSARSSAQSTVSNKRLSYPPVLDFITGHTSDTIFSYCFNFWRTDNNHPAFRIRPNSPCFTPRFRFNNRAHNIYIYLCTPLCATLSNARLPVTSTPSTTASIFGSTRRRPRSPVPVPHCPNTRFHILYIVRWSINDYTR